MTEFDIGHECLWRVWYIIAEERIYQGMLAQESYWREYGLKRNEYRSLMLKRPKNETLQ